MCMTDVLSLDEAQNVLTAALGDQQEANRVASTTAAAVAAEGEGCVRCGAARADLGGDFCEPCRSWLLGDSTVDPVVVSATRGTGPFGDRNLGDLLEAGEVHLLTEDRRIVTGADALAHLVAQHGAELS